MRKKLSFLFILASFSFSVLAQSNNSKFVDNRTYFRSSTSIEIENMIYFVTMFYDSKMFAKGEIGIVGAIYNIENGKVDFFKNLAKKKKEDKKLVNVS